MPSYCFKATYTHDDPKVDRRRRSFIIKSDVGVMDAIEQAISTLKIGHMRDEVIRDYLESSEEDDTSEGWSWVSHDNNGQWDLEWEPFDAGEDEDTETFYVFNQADDEGFHEIKDETGSVIATAADTDDQTYDTLRVMGYDDFDVEVVYDKQEWDAIGRED